MDTTLGLAKPPVVSCGPTPTLRAILHPQGAGTQDKRPACHPGVSIAMRLPLGQQPQLMSLPDLAQERSPWPRGFSKCWGLSKLGDRLFTPRAPRSYTLMGWLVGSTHKWVCV